MHVAFVAFGFVETGVDGRGCCGRTSPLVLTVTLFAFGADCPLTDLEKYLRRQAGEPVYRTASTPTTSCRASRRRPRVLPVFVVTLTVIAYAR